VVISFHSLEDRIVKQFIAKHSKEVVDRRAPFAEPPPTLLRALAASRAKRSRSGGQPAFAQRRACAWPSARRRRHDAAVHRSAGRSWFSALYLVRVQYESRRLFTELDRATAEARRLDTEHSA
jgi:hypothetical protein